MKAKGKKTFDSFSPTLTAIIIAAVIYILFGIFATSYALDFAKKTSNSDSEPESRIAANYSYVIDTDEFPLSAFNRTASQFEKKSDISILTETPSVNAEDFPVPSYDSLYQGAPEDIHELNIYGRSDLAPSIVGVGYIDSESGNFVSSSSPSTFENIAVRFSVENLGTADTGPWDFTAVLPTFPMRIYESEEYGSLAPFDKAFFTLSFDRAIAGEYGTVTINVDPRRILAESSEDNNVDRIVIYPF